MNFNYSEDALSQIFGVKHVSRKRQHWNTLFEKT